VKFDGPIKVDLQRLELQMRSAETELALWNRRIATMEERCVQEQMHIKTFCKSQGYEVAGPYLRSIKEDYESQINMLRLQTAKLQSQIDIMKAMKEDAERNVVVPGHFS
jgi:chromosome segregation ATPase